MRAVHAGYIAVFGSLLPAASALRLTFTGSGDAGKVDLRSCEGSLVAFFLDRVLSPSTD